MTCSGWSSTRAPTSGSPSTATPTGCSPSTPTARCVDGDQIIAICAIDRHERGLLAHDTVVVTVMTNLGFRLGMADRGITVVDTDVGDRYVLEALDDGGFVLGGEQSGHVIFRDLATTGDGLLTGLDPARRRWRAPVDRWPTWRPRP